MVYMYRSNFRIRFTNSRYFTCRTEGIKWYGFYYPEESLKIQGWMTKGDTWDFEKRVKYSFSRYDGKIKIYNVGLIDHLKLQTKEN